jgi:hypothetical protein
LNEEQVRALQALSREQPYFGETERLSGGEKLRVEFVRTQRGKENVDWLGPYTVDEQPGPQWIFLRRDSYERP